MRGYLATPSGGGPWPRVIVIPEAFGLVDDMRRDAHRAVGFVGRIPGFGHVEDAAEDAWSRVFAAFGKHLA